MFQNLRQKRNEGGFTLIELLVVIVILGILAAVVVFAVGGISDKGDDAATDTDLKTVQTAEEAYYAKTPAGGNAVYGTEKDLVVTGKVLAQNSEKHDVCLAKTALAGGDKKAYLVVAQGATAASCATSSTVAGDTAADWYTPEEAP